MTQDRVGEAEGTPQDAADLLGAVLAGFGSGDEDRPSGHGARDGAEAESTQPGTIREGVFAAMTEAPAFAADVLLL